MVACTQAIRVAITTPVTARARTVARGSPPSSPAMWSIAPGIWTPTNTHNEPLIRNVAMSQNACACRRERARITVGPT
ncbi:Uncharacterised protein [Mycobacterium tuberculosis]|uniref:Uncharacterized protein n=1 Tax=Mycobacterium tuberculosis TaxID=1773 RepID=A0A916LEK2_MYCTX|nr:Uncharacterised protein [Mycobacterium tuberculosis]